MNSNVYMFDVDGTLTPARKPMMQAHFKIFEKFVKNNIVYLVTGSDIKKTKEQVPKAILDNCKGIFASSGNELWKGEEKIYENLYIPSKKLIEDLELALRETPYTTKTGLHTEHRPGMINFSIVGRNATQDQRKDYHKWDSRTKERKLLAVKLMSRHPEIDIKIGGEISIDIYPKGLDKSQAVSYVRQEDELKNPIVFFGDRTDKQGNDYAVVQALGDLDTVHQIDNYGDTFKLLENYMESDS